MYRKFLDPTTDLTFKKIFGDKNRSDILIAFLNTVLELQEGHKITEVIFTNTYNIPEIIESKLSIVDIKCKDQSNHSYIVEMQAINEKDYLNRAQYYTSLEVSRQLDKGEKYKELKPVIFIAVSNFTLFNNEYYLNHYLLLNTKTYKNDLDLMEFHFIELSKFTKTLEELNSIIDQWAYFLKHASEVYEVPKELKDNHAITDAFEVLKQTNFTREELESYDKLIDEYRLELSRSTERHDSFEDGKLEGQLEGKLEVAKNLLKQGMPINQISQVTGLSINELKNL